MTKLHSVHPKKGRGHFDLCLLVILIILLSCGLIILYSATRYTDAKEHPGQPFYTIIRQVIFLAAAFVSMLFMSKTDYHKLLKLALPGFLLSIALGILVLFFGKEVNGRKTLVCSRTDLLSAGRVCKAYADFHAELIFS